MEDQLTLRKTIESFKKKPIDYDYDPRGIGPKNHEYIYRGMVVNYFKDLFDDEGIDMYAIKSGEIYQGDGYLLRVVYAGDEHVRCRVLVRNIVGG